MKRFLPCLLLAAGLLAAAQNPGDSPKEEHKGGIAEVSVLWKWANFAILVGVLGYLAQKQAGPILTRRSAEISEGLAAGEQAKADAEAKAKDVDTRLGNLEGEVVKIRVQAKEDREREGARLHKELLLEMERIRHHAQMEIESASKQAAIEVRRYAASLALDLAESKVRSRMSLDTQDALFTNFVKKVAGAETRPAVIE